MTTGKLYALVLSGVGSGLVGGDAFNGLVAVKIEKSGGGKDIKVEVWWWDGGLMVGRCNGGGLKARKMYTNISS